MMKQSFANIAPPELPDKGITQMSIDERKGVEDSKGVSYSDIIRNNT